MGVRCVAFSYIDRKDTKKKRKTQYNKTKQHKYNYEDIRKNSRQEKILCSVFMYRQTNKTQVNASGGCEGGAWCVTTLKIEVTVIGHGPGYGGTRACCIAGVNGWWDQKLCRVWCRQTLLCRVLGVYACACALSVCRSYRIVKFVVPFAQRRVFSKVPVAP